MPPPFIPNEGTLYSAKDWQAKFAGSKLRLFKSGFVPTPTTTREELEAQECDFDGYAEVTIAAWLDPLLSDQGGHQISAPTQQIDAAAPFTVSNLVGGYWIETPDVVGPPAVAPEVIVIRQFDTPVSVGAANTGVQIAPTFVVPNN